jgi:ATP-binding cassette subfamily C protein CydD
MVIHARAAGLVGASEQETTLAALLMRFIEPQRKPLTNLGPCTDAPAGLWRSQVAWVPQDPHLFHGTLAANLRLARPQASLQEIDAAVKAAHLDEFVSTLPEGYETLIGEDGAGLSRGEAQRLALARAFLKDAPILILTNPPPASTPLKSCRSSLPSAA